MNAAPLCVFFWGELFSIFIQQFRYTLGIENEFLSGLSSRSIMQETFVLVKRITCLEEKISVPFCTVISNISN